MRDAKKSTSTIAIGLSTVALATLAGLAGLPLVACSSDAGADPMADDAAARRNCPKGPPCKVDVTADGGSDTGPVVPPPPPDAGSPDAQIQTPQTIVAASRSTDWSQAGI